MYRMVIISCLIAAGYAEIVMPLHIRQPRQTSEHLQTTRDIPTYPTYSQTQNKETMVESNIVQRSDLTVPSIPQKSDSTVSKTTENSESLLNKVKSYLNDLVSHGARASNYLLQAFGAIFLGSAAYNMVCSYTNFCTYLGITQVEHLARVYGAEDLASIITKVMNEPR